jgi:hypothetical protein
MDVRLRNALFFSVLLFFVMFATAVAYTPLRCGIDFGTPSASMYCFADRSLWSEVADFARYKGSMVAGIADAVRVHPLLVAIAVFISAGTVVLSSFLRTKPVFLFLENPRVRIPALYLSTWLVLLCVAMILSYLWSYSFARITHYGFMP